MNTNNINCIIVNGIISRSSSEIISLEQEQKKWTTWIKEQLEEKGIQTFIPNMPTPWQPIYKDWKKYFEKLAVHEHTILIGRSAAAAFLVRWIGENKQRIKKLILIAPGKNSSSNSQYTQDLYDFEINPNIKEYVGEIIIFTSPEEPHYRQENVLLYKELLNARVVSLQGKGHYVSKDLKSRELPELLEEILK